MSESRPPDPPFRSPRRPTWIEIDQDALGRNVRAMVTALAGTPLMAVVKADAYGHGAVGVARIALRHGASWVATATVTEALELRHDGIAAPILVFGYTAPEQVAAAVAGRLAVTAFDREVLAALDRAGDEQGRPGIAHLKVDSGMNRLGVSSEEFADFVRGARDFPHVELEGCYTHFRKGADRAVTLAQLKRFEAALGAAEAVGQHFRLRHAANSAAWVTVPESRLDLVRSGIEMLGLRTPDGRQREPVLSFRSTVAQVREVSAGEYVGYGDAFRAERPMRIATLPVGYGDGVRWGPRSWGAVLIGGRERPLVGDVCMDVSMVDVSQAPQVSAGDVATLIGTDGEAQLSAELVAQRLGTINYEVTTCLRDRVPREFLTALPCDEAE
ncbi:MAG TPA: alanine racemase [Candidatus Dormibacteraeota bacterium]|nr:alanine racemase [Candidatus Dormibacteraeota bacterium]